VNTLAVAPNGSIFAAGWYGVIRSTDDGNVWSWVLPNNSGFSPTALTVTPNGDVFVESDVAVLRSTDNGNSWNDENEGLWLWGGGPTCFGLSPDGFIYAGTWYGLFKSHEITTFVDPSVHISLPSHVSLSQNYPNPFNPSTVIRYSLPVVSQVKLRIFNLLGQEVTTLVDGMRDAGYESAEWDASGNASGVYFYRIEAVNVADPAKAYVETKKIMLMK